MEGKLLQGFTKKETPFEIVVCIIHKIEFCHNCCVDFREMNKDCRQAAEKSDALLCHSGTCRKASKQLCSQCKMVRYCSKDCQKQDWPTHKGPCKLTGTTKPLRLNLSVAGRPDRFVPVFPLGTKVSLITGSLHGDVKGKVVAFNRGKGPYADPEVKYDPRLMRVIDPDDTDFFCTYSIKIKGSGEVWKIECTEVHERWQVYGNNDSPALTSAPVDVSTLTLPITPKFLILSNFGFLSTADCVYSQGLGNVLGPEVANIDNDRADFTNKDDLIARLRSGRYSACVFCGVGTGGPAIMKELLHEDLRQVVVTWVGSGGKLLLQGEGSLAKILQDWFELPWEFSSYERDDQYRGGNLSTSSSSAFPHELPIALLARLPEQYSAKACLLDGVEPSCCVYGTCDGLVSAAVRAVGSKGGRVAVFGDVNAETYTLAAMVVVGR